MIIVPIKWLFHWEYTQHFQTNPYGQSIEIVEALARSHCQIGPQHGIVRIVLQACHQIVDLVAPGLSSFQIFPETGGAVEISLPASSQDILSLLQLIEARIGIAWAHLRFHQWANILIANW